MNQDSVAGIVTCYGLYSPEIKSWWGGMIFFARPALEPTLSPVLWYQISLLVVKQPGHGIDHKPPSNATVKERVELYLCAPWTFVACSRMSFTFTFTFFCVLYRASHNVLRDYKNLL